MTQILVVLILALGLSGCASLNAHDPFRLSDGSLNVPKILQYVDYGIEADCALMTADKVGQDICTFGREAYDVAQAAREQNPVGQAAAVKKAWLSLEDRLGPVNGAMLDQYLKWALLVLGGQS